MLWGLGQLGHCPVDLLDGIAAHLQRPGVLAGFDVRLLAMTTYAFAALDFFPGACVQRRAVLGREAGRLLAISHSCGVPLMLSP